MKSLYRISVRYFHGCTLQGLRLTADKTWSLTKYMTDEEVKSLVRKLEQVTTILAVTVLEG